MTPAEFRHALECWQLDVDVFRRDAFNAALYDVEIHYGAASYKDRLFFNTFHRDTVNHIAKAVLGGCLACGHHPIHPNMRSIGESLCRSCAIQRGHAAMFRHTFDLDKLRQKLGPAELRLLIQDCSWEEPER